MAPAPEMVLREMPFWESEEPVLQEDKKSSSEAKKSSEVNSKNRFIKCNKAVQVLCY